MNDDLTEADAVKEWSKCASAIFYFSLPFGLVFSHCSPARDFDFPLICMPLMRYPAAGCARTRFQHTG
jgi:hypothetical protein